MGPAYNIMAPVPPRKLFESQMTNNNAHDPSATAMGVVNSNDALNDEHIVNRATRGYSTVSNPPPTHRIPAQQSQQSVQLVMTEIQLHH